MSIGIWFWVLMLLVLVFGVWRGWAEPLQLRHELLAVVPIVPARLACVWVPHPRLIRRTNRDTHLS